MQLNDIDLNKLNVFFNVAEQGGVTPAAQKLLLTRSAISQSLSSLEAKLELKLFHRVGKRLVLTSEGQRLFRQVRRYQAELEQALNELVEQKHEMSGMIRVGAFSELARAQLSPHIASFLARNSKVRIKLLFSGPSELNAMVLENKVDLAFSIYPHEHKNVTSQRAFLQELVLVSGKRLAKRLKTAADVSKLPIVDYYQSNVLMKRWLSRYEAVSTSALNIRAYAASTDVAIELIRQGVGVGIVPRYLAQPFVKTGELLIKEFGRPSLIDYIWLNELRSSYKSPALRAFREEILGESAITQKSAHERNRFLHV